MYEELDRSPKQNRSTRSPRQPQRQWAEPARADEPIREMKPPGLQSNTNLANVSIDSPQPKASPPSDPEDIVVPRIFIPGKLYFVGENHNVSKENREAEKRLSYEQTGSKKYLQEFELKEAAFDSSGNVTEGREPADPWNMRMMQTILSMTNEIEYIQDYIQDKLGEKENLSGLVQEDDTFLQLICKKMLKHTEYMWDKLMDLKEGKDGFKWRESNGEEAVQELETKFDRVDILGLRFEDILDKWLELPSEEIIN